MEIVQSGDPVGEVVSLDDLKRQLRICHSDDDPVLDQCIADAVDWVQDVCAAVLLTTEFTATGSDFCLSFDGYPNPDIKSISYIDEDGEAGTVTDFSIEDGRLVIEDEPDIQSATIVFEAGIGEADIPAKLKRSVLQLAEVFFDRSGDGIPAGVKAMVAHHRSFAF